MSITRKIKRRLLDCIFNRDSYRRVLCARALDWIIRRYNTNVKYFVVESPHGLIMTPLGDSVITPYILAQSALQLDEFRETLQSIASAKCNPNYFSNKIFVDIGANIGTHSIYALNNQFSKALCVEPVSQNILRLRMNLAINNLLDRCVISETALSSLPGTAQIALSPSNCGDNRVLSANQTNSTDGVTIRLSTLDNLIAENHFDPSSIGLLWIDTQGHEAFVIEGAKALINRVLVPICVEVWPHLLREKQSVDMFCDTLKVYKQYMSLDHFPRKWLPIHDLRELIDNTLDSDLFFDIVIV